MNLRILLLISIPLFFLCCGPEKAAKEKPSAQKEHSIKPKKKKTKQKKKEPKKEGPQFTYLNKWNAVKELSEYGKRNPETLVLMKTSFGDMKIKLYKETPLHRANFIRLVKNNYFNASVFYRVVKNFIIQGGNSDEPDHNNRRARLGKYFIPPEFNPSLYHKKGALSAAREYDDNPRKLTSPYEFFIVQGEPLIKSELDEIKDPEIRKVYEEMGGSPHLDGEHTVFGEVIEGLDVIDKIASVEVDGYDWPKDDIKVWRVEIIK